MEQLQDLTIKRMLFICHAHRGRSQMAEGIFRCKYPDIPVVSAGVDVTSSKQPDNKPNPAVIAEMQRHDIDISSQIVKQLEEGDITTDTDVVVFCDSLLPQFVVERARSVAAIRILDPGDLHILKHTPFEVILPYVYEELDRLISEELQDILKRVRGRKSIINPFIVFPNKVDFPTELPRLIQPWEVLEDYKL